MTFQTGLMLDTFPPLRGDPCEAGTRCSTRSATHRPGALVEPSQEQVVEVDRPHPVCDLFHGDPLADQQLAQEDAPVAEVQDPVRAHLADDTVRRVLVQWQGEHDKVGKTRVTPLSGRAVEIIELALANRREEGLDGSPWLIPAENDPTRPVPRSRLDNWMRATKKARGLDIPRLGYHGEKQAGIRDPKFRKLDPAVQEELAGTTWETMRRVYDYVDVPTLRAAVASLEGGSKRRKKASGTARKTRSGN